MMARALRFGTCAVVAGLLGSCGLDSEVGEGTAGSASRPKVAATSAALSSPPDTNCTSYVNSGRQYWVCTHSKSWSVARQKCTAVGLDLAIVNDATENAYIRSKLVADAWLGGSDQDTEGTWRWGEPATGTEFWQGGWTGTAVAGAYENWDTFEPGGSLDDCLEMDKFSGEWEDHSCGLLFDYVCEGVEDECPGYPETEAGQCGCGNPETDTDGDGTADCIDECINDPNKTEAGDCGCGNPDTDSDNDGTADCIDECPADPTTTVEPCSPDVLCTMATFDGTSYFFCTKERDHDDAKMKCESIGFALARIDTPEENDFIKQNLGGDEMYVGGNDMAAEGTWIWEFGGDQFWDGDEHGNPVASAYTNWDSGQPNDFANQDCMVVKYNGEWLDVDCGEKEGYVCEQVFDECPENPAKIKAGLCGCEELDIDEDQDGVPACLEDCDKDPHRLTFGVCGCKGEPFPRDEGYPCDDGPCGPAVCDGAGSCGSPTLDECIPPGPSRGCVVELHDGHAYLFCTVDGPPDDASDFCNLVGMELVRIDDAEEDAFVAAHLTETSWIGATDIVEGEWRWTDGDTLFWEGDSTGTLVPGEYANWDVGEPGSFGSDCAVYAVSGGNPIGWEDRSCGATEAFVCEKIDQCPTDPFKDKPGFCGCELPENEVTVDGEQVIVCSPQCTARCGCDMPASLCPLECPNNLSDPSSPVYGKLQRGRCGCNTPDVDADSNGVLDCFEGGLPDCDGQAPGTPCYDSICEQSCPVTTACNGAGVCGDPDECAPTGGGTCFYRVFRDHVYWFCDGQATRDEAQDICGQDGAGYLVSIDDEAENEFIQANITADSLTGGNQETAPGDWWWSNATCDDAEPFWDGGESGEPHRGSAYTNFEGGAPGIGDFAVILAGTGTWRTQSGGSFAFVCEKPRPLAPHCGEEPPCLAEYLGVGPCAPAGEHEECVPLDDAVPALFADLADLTEEEVIAAVDVCAEACACGEACSEGGCTPEESVQCEEDCEAACAGQGLEPPGEGDTCPPIFVDNPEMAELCLLEEAYIAPASGKMVLCEETSDCVFHDPDLVCGFFRDCQREGGDPLVDVCPPDDPDEDVPVEEGGETGTVRVCGTPSDKCLTGLGDPLRCSTTPLICEPPENRQVVEDIEFPEGPPEPVCPSELFLNPPEDEPVLTIPYDSWAEPCGPSGCTGPDESGERHPYCAYRAPMDGQKDNEIHPDRNHAAARNQNAAGSPSIIDFEFDPRLDLDYRAEIGPLGVPDIGVTAGAGLVATAVFNGDPLPFSGDFELVNLTARVHAERCTVTTEGSAIRLFERDFLPEEASIDIGDEDCEEAFDNFETHANRASKAMRDVASLLKQYESAQAAGKRLDLSSLCEAGGVLDDPPADFPLPMGCAEQPPESHINELIDYYEQQVRDLEDAGRALGGDAFSVGAESDVFESEDGDEEVTLFTAQFFIGPIPVLLEAFIAAHYDIGLTFEYRLNPGNAVAALLLPNPNIDLDPNQTSEDHELLAVFVHGGPNAQAFLGFFAGAGFSVGVASASIGIEARLSLGMLRLDVDGGAGLFMAGQRDPRPLGPDLESLVLPGAEPLIDPLVYRLKLGYSAGLSAGIQNILSGEVNGRLRLKFFFFSLTYRQRLLRFDGICTEPGEEPGQLGAFPCHIPILELGQEATLADLPWATVRMSQILPRLEYLPFVPEPDPSDPDAPPPQAVDLTHVEELFYDRLCSCVRPGEECNSTGDCCDDLLCADDGTGTTTCGCRDFEETCATTADCCLGRLCSDDGTGTRTCGCRMAGDTCGTSDDCCTGLPCVGGVCQCTDPQDPCLPGSDACCGGAECISVPGGGRCHCSGAGDVCHDEDDCCSGPCLGGICQCTPQTGACSADGECCPGAGPCKPVPDGGRCGCAGINHQCASTADCCTTDGTTCCPDGTCGYCPT